MSTAAGSLLFMGPKNKFFHAYNSIITATAGSAESGLIKSFTPEFTYRVFWEWSVQMNDFVAIPGSLTGWHGGFPGIRIYATGFTSTNGDVVKWAPGSLSETHTQGSFILPQGTDGLAFSAFNLDATDNIRCFLNVFAVRLSPMSDEWKNYPWEG